MDFGHKIIGSYLRSKWNLTSKKLTPCMKKINSVCELIHYVLENIFHSTVHNYPRPSIDYQIKIPVISPGAYFWSKGLFWKKIFLGGLIFGGGLYMDEYLRFEKLMLFFFQVIVIFWDFLLTTYVYYWILHFFIFNNVLTTVNTTLYTTKYLPPKFNVMFKFNYSKYNPRGLNFGEAYSWKELKILFQKLVPKCPRAYTQWGLLSEFYGMLFDTLGGGGWGVQKE